MKLALGLKADMPFGKCCLNFPNVECHGPNMLAFSLTHIECFRGVYG
jgi:hypothetical protein